MKGKFCINHGGDLALNLDRKSEFGIGLICGFNLGKGKD